MTGRAFVDTNVLVYAHDVAEVHKRRRPLDVLRELPATSLVLSGQVLSEFFTVVTRRIAVPLSVEDAAAAVRGLARLSVVPVDAPTVLRAIDLRQRWQTSYWDGLILAAAETSGCDRILTEDLASGATLAGIAIENPFA